MRKRIDIFHHKVQIELLLLLVLSVFVPQRSLAQDAAIKTNVLYDATLTPNLGVEVRMSDKWTFDLSGNLNLWTVGDGHKWRHWLVQPEARFWLCQSFAGHFFGIHALGGQYNFGNLNMPFKFLGTDYNKLKNQRFEGWGVGAGIAYGYAWPIGRHWNIEAELGLGWVWTKFDSYPCAKCGSRIDKGKTHNYVGPTKIAVTVEHVF